MKKYILFAYAAVLLLTCFLSSLKGQDSLVLDLGLYEPGSIKTIEGNHTYDSIILRSAVLGYNYNIEISKLAELLPPLSYSGISKKDRLDEKSDKCQNLRDKITALKSFQENNDNAKRTEKELFELVNDLKTELKKDTCNNDPLASDASFWIKTTRLVHDEKVKINTGEKVIITVRRDSLKWTFVFKGSDRGKWVTTYGFGFTSAALEKDTYYSKQVPDTTVFQILKADKAPVLELNYVPAIFFSYFPSQRFNKSVNHSFTTGLGFDLSAPVVFFGYNFLYNHNIGLSAGLVFQQQDRLKPQYSDKEIIATNLEKDQLHDKIYGLNIFLSVNFRFGENPFNSVDTNVGD